MIDLRQSPCYARYMASRGWRVVKVPSFSLLRNTSRIRSSIFVYIKKIPLIPFSVMKIQRSLLPDFQALEQITKKQRSLLTIIEPGITTRKLDSKIVSILESHGYRKDKRLLLPSLTLRINLRQNPTTLFQSLKKDCRRSIRKAKVLCRAKILDLNSEDKLSDFYFAWKRSGKGFIPSLTELRQLFEAFGKKAFVVGVLTKDEKLLAGTIILQSQNCAWYYYAFTAPTGRRLFAGYLVVWKAMLEAKRRGCTVFDLEGIFDRRYGFLHRWQGFSQFKKKFGGVEVSYPGSFLRYCFPF